MLRILSTYQVIMPGVQIGFSPDHGYVDEIPKEF